jgi:starch phosphorylase
MFNEILSNDVYYITKDLPLYLDSLKDVDRNWKDRDDWNSKMIVNISKSGFFDINRLIEDYCNKVWYIPTNSVINN